MYKPNKQELQEFMTRGVTHVIPNDELEQKLRTGKRIRTYLGVDPTGADIHLGHAVVLRKMRTLQDWGHEIIFLIGDFTAQIGDPTGRDVLRQPLTRKQILENARDYKKQVSRIVRFTGPNKARVKNNNTWLSKLSFQDVIELSSYFTVQQMLERDMFQERIKRERPIGLHEFLYPLMVGYDCVTMNVDMEMGGNDQLFNIMFGRTLMMSMKGKSKIVFTCELLRGTDGRKMSKSYGNVINITDEPQDMYGKVMSIPDEQIGWYFTLCTDRPIDEIKKFNKQMQNKKMNPRDVKGELAHDIVTLYHGKDSAEAAGDAFVAQFKKGELPDDIPSTKLKHKKGSIVDVLIELKLVSSKSNARRTVEQGGVRVNQEKVEDPKEKMSFKSGDVVQVGKRKFVRVK